MEKVFGYTPTLELYNLIPGRTYYWKVRGTYSNDTSEVGSFTTKQSAVRAISVDGVSNVRDLGGYKVGNGNVNYGLLYRGGKLNGTVNGEAVTDEGKATMLNRLGIKTEIDLRSESDDGGQTQNAIGENVKYVKIPLGQYANVIDYESWRNLGKDKVSGGYDANNKNAIKDLFELLADESNYPVYFHCNAGADRTGTLALLINGLLGVDEQSLIKDYELTTFSRYGRRLRSGVAEDGKSFTSSGIMQNDGGNYVAMGLFIDALKANYTVNGTINEAVYNYLIEYIGLSNETIDRIKGILLSETSSGEECKKIDGVQEILLADDVKSIDISDCGVELICSWARVGDGDHAYRLLQELLKNKTHPNLWDVHPPFQIDGNFGAVAGMTEMIVQSHDGAITLLPTLPERWKDLRVKGLKARGNFTIDISCKNGVIEYADIKSCVGGKAYIRCEEFFNVEVRSDGRRIAYSANEDTIVFDTEIGKSFRITGFKRAERLPTVCNLNAAWEKGGVALSWEENGLKYAVYRGKDNEKDYRLIGVTSEGRFIDKEYNENAKALLTYKVVAYRGGKHSSRMQGAIAVVNPATELEKERYKLKFRMNNINLE